eukprot:m.446995 g.446995  ORF g.446995 m.446995 type:complete len:76 (+) comp19456_c0_seq1:219-446(+)
MLSERVLRYTRSPRRSSAMLGIAATLPMLGSYSAYPTVLVRRRTTTPTTAATKTTLARPSTTYATLEVSPAALLP